MPFSVSGFSYGLGFGLFAVLVGYFLFAFPFRLFRRFSGISED